MKAKPHKIRGVYVINNEIATQGEPVYGEKIIGEYRLWDPRRSKLAALIKKQVDLPIDPEQIVLYLGAASGTTVSHVADIVSLIYAVEISPRVVRDLLTVCERRKNIVPLIADAARPDYGEIVELVDFLYQDVAQRQQADIATKNAEMFLRSGGYALIMIKARSIDVTARPQTVYRSQIKKLEELFDIQLVRALEPFYQDHAAVVAKLK